MRSPKTPKDPGSTRELGHNEMKTCPSAPCVEGALLLGVMTESGHLAYVQPPSHIDGDFVARAQAGGRPEARFRFCCRAPGRLSAVDWGRLRRRRQARRGGATLGIDAATHVHDQAHMPLVRPTWRRRMCGLSYRRCRCRRHRDLQHPATTGLSWPHPSRLLTQGSRGQVHLVPTALAAANTPFSSDS